MTFKKIFVIVGSHVNLNNLKRILLGNLCLNNDESKAIRIF